MRHVELCRTVCIWQLHRPSACRMIHEVIMQPSCASPPCSMQPCSSPLPPFAQQLYLSSLVHLVLGNSLICRPARGDLVAVVGETFGDAAIRNMAARMRASPTGTQILADRPRVTVSQHLTSWHYYSSFLKCWLLQLLLSKGRHFSETTVRWDSCVFSSSAAACIIKLLSSAT
eukprot:GHUV01031645.1.p1 GENE.GHUV01031645.1~~GHUV01031645.1.p1  ORF type:complete len:173 (+),score=14.24 GHUV01031645.1:765-1283(+)